MKLETLRKQSRTLVGPKRAFQHFAVRFTDRGDFESAMSLYYDALYIQEAMEDSSGMAWSYNNIGYLFFTQENFDKTFINYEKAETYKDFGGIRIEDDILVTETGHKILTRQCPHSPVLS